VSSAGEMSGRDARAKAEISGKLMQNARRGIGFLYCGYMLDRKRAGDDRDEDLEFLEELFAYLNSPDMLAFIARVSGREDIVRADAQCTRYSAGQYLTRHQDVIDGQARRLAYVFGFTREWHPDWGGLLQFFGDDGAPRDAWMPSFNCLVLFDVRHVHSVTYVTPFAGADRLSITGWFHAANP
ncbi:MAG: 2OG-Fe(II) oxygenase family protein, partial [Woeseiaceae bacterium]